MGRRKVEIHYRPDKRQRLKNFVDRKAGLFKKATQFSILCACNISVWIESENGDVFEFGANGRAKVSTSSVSADNDNDTDKDAKDESPSAQSPLEDVNSQIPCWDGPVPHSPSAQSSFQVVNSQIPCPFFEMEMENDPNYIHDAAVPSSIDVGSYLPEMILPDDLPLQFPDISEWY